eukprot:CAMPEP_0118643320 /NCGR_PEP_ID=MMETSP0785-20121206/6328_1 /TAXON_ID=91992 /ORGANISM="Bolidomonas pacifica, Strain CCMP 1866" /LENGTH=2654 /DNA_ID=CAMNT_0006534975 /DNA_START=85 /DNA_END=8046 /DNA_ORIENTATION=+
MTITTDILRSTSYASASKFFSFVVIPPVLKVKLHGGIDGDPCADVPGLASELSVLLLKSKRKDAPPQFFSSRRSAAIFLSFVTTLFLNAEDDKTKASIAKSLCGFAHHLANLLRPPSPPPPPTSSSHMSDFKKTLENSVTSLLSTCSDLSEILETFFLPVATSSASPAFSAAASIIALLSPTAHLDFIIPVYSKVALTATTSHVTLFALSPFISSTPPSSILSSLASSLTMKLKSSPESSLPLVLSLLSSLPPSSLTTDFVTRTNLPEALLKQLKSTKADISSLALSSYLCALSSSDSPSTKDALLNPLATSLSTLTQPSAQYNALKALAFSPTSSLAPTISSAVTKVLPKTSATQANQSLAYKLLLLLHLSHPSEVSPSLILPALSSTLSSPLPAKPSASQTQNLRNQLDALNTLYASSGNLNEDLVPKLTALVTSALGSKSSTPQLEAIMALRLLTMSPLPADSPLEKAFISSSSFLYAPSLVNSSDPLISHLPHVLLNYTSNSPTTDIFAPSSPAPATFAALLAHPSSGVVRRESLSVLHSLLPHLDSVPTPLDPTTPLDSLSSSLYDLVLTKGASPVKTKRDIAALRATVEPVTIDQEPPNPSRAIAVSSATLLSAGVLNPTMFLLSFVSNKTLFASILELYSSNIITPSFPPALSSTIVSALSSSNGHLTSAAVNLISALTDMASVYDPEFDDDADFSPHIPATQSFIIDVLAPSIVSSLENISTTVRSLTEDELSTYTHPEGELYESDASSSSTTSSSGAAQKSSKSSSSNKNVKKTTKTRKGKGNFGADFEDEEWEREVKKELEKKKPTGGAPTARTYSAAEMKTIKAQSESRASTTSIFSAYLAHLSAISAIADTDCSIGNACLPSFGDPVLSLSLPPLLPHPLRKASFSTLVSLCSTIYELPPSSAVPLAATLTLTKNGSTPLPSPCYSASAVVDSIVSSPPPLSGNSFTLVFPVLKSALIGQKRSSLIADSALSILHLHAPSLPTCPPVHALRRQMTEAILSLLSHDRHKTFTDPTPSEALQSIFDTPTLSSPVSPAELSPLLNDQGALGRKAAQIASLLALSTVTSYQSLSSNPLVESRVFSLRYSSDPEISAAAEATYRSLRKPPSPDDPPPPPSKLLAIPLINLLTSSPSTPTALAAFTSLHPSTIPTVLSKLLATYVGAFPTKFPTDSKSSRNSKKSLEAQFLAPSNASGDASSSTLDNPALQSSRFGVMSAVCEVADFKPTPLLDSDHISFLTTFILSYALTDPFDSIRAKGVEAGRKLVKTFGSANLPYLLPLLEATLSTGTPPRPSSTLDLSKSVNQVWATDYRKEGSVVLLGSAALHLAEDDAKIASTISLLLTALDTPSESVQSSVATVLSPLMKKGDTKERAEEIIDSLMKKTLKEPKLAPRRGAAFGIAAVVKGFGIASLKKYEIVNRLMDAMTCTYAVSKEGALFAVELLCERLGLLFEPYIIVLLPALLKTFGDSSDHVRAAAGNTAGLIMSKLSAHGVKLVMPAVLKAFDEDNWRAKQASIRMLGAMTNCAPKQLASCLPKIVPKLTEAFSDTHPKVKASAEAALQSIVTVIRNPEVALLSKVLLKALVDPANSTKRGLEGLLSTEFLHAIDAPSLALLIPVLQRGLKDKSGVAKRQSALIIGNMVTMCNDPKDFAPYMSTLLPGLKATLLDPIPDVRTTASKSVGSLARGLGVEQLPDLESWLRETLKSEDGTSVERSGAAQGLCEYLVAKGGNVVFEVMTNELIPLSTHPKATTREGVLWVLTFLPNVLNQNYAPLIDPSLPALLSGLSDESEPVREVAMRAGRVLIRSMGKTHTPKILPALESGLLDDNYRIRMASLNLIGDLLSLLGGVQISGVGSEDDTKGAEKAQAQIALALGSETRARVLARLYMSRSDTSSVVRQGAIQVWKTVVSVTPRTLREILPVLISHVVEALASNNSEMTTVAGRCLGDIVKKLGDSVLPEVIPILQKALYEGDETTRRGVCVGLSEIIEGGSKEVISKFMDTVSAAVRDALCDTDEGVRRLAAGCFQQLCSTVGGSSVTEIIVPSLLVKLEKGSKEGGEEDGRRALLGLKEVLRIRSRELLPYLVPKLLADGVTTKNAVILSNVIEATGHAIHMHLLTIVPEITNALADCDPEDTERLEKLQGIVRSLSSNIAEDGINWLVSELAKKCGHDKPHVRKSAVYMLGVFAEERKVHGDFSDQVPILLREVLNRLVDENGEVLAANSIALTSVMKSVPPEELVRHVEFSHNLINSLVSEARRKKGGVGDGVFLMPGFCRKKGLDALIPMYHHAVLSAGTRGVAAKGIGELIEMTDPKFLAATVVVKFVGPLIRVVGDRNEASTKSAIIKTLHVILNKAGKALRAFVPQLQTTFLKALGDTHRSVRVAAAQALGDLMTLASRVDPLITELTNQSLSASVVAVQTAHLQALSKVLVGGGSKSKKPEVIEAAFDAAKELVGVNDDGARLGAGDVLGACIELLGQERGFELLEEEGESDGAKRGIIIRCALEKLDLTQVSDELLDRLSSEAINLAGDVSGKSAARSAGCRAFGILINPTNISTFAPTVIKNLAIGDGMDDINVATLAGLKIAGMRNPGIFLSSDSYKIVSAAVNLSKLGNSRTQYVSNKFLFVAFNAHEGEEGGVDKFAKLAGG